MARYDDLNTSMIGYGAFISSLLLIVIIVGVEALSYSWENMQQEFKLKNSEYVASTEILDAQKKSLQNYGWVEVPAPEPEKGQPKAAPTRRLQISIEQAKKLTMEEMKKATNLKPGT